METSSKQTVFRRSFIAFIILLFCALASATSQVPFVTLWQTTTANEQITIPTHSGSNYNYNIDWGDGTIETNVTGNAVHTYATPGSKTISITGIFPRIFFSNNPASDKDKIFEVSQWGDITWTSMQRAFYGCSNLNVTATDAPDLSNATNMRDMFRNTDLSVGNVGNWDVSNVTDMVGLFRNTLFNSPLASWDVSNVTLFHFMFFSADLFNQPIGNWDVSNATNMRDMFGYAASFDQDLSNWEVSNVTNMFAMFQGTGDYDQDMSNWDVSSVTNMAGMFIDAHSFNQDITGWDVGSVTNMFAMFAGAHDFNQDIGAWDVSQVNTMRDMFFLAKTFNQDIGSWDVSSVTDMSRMFHTATNFDQDIGDWDVGNVTTMDRMFTNAGLSQPNYDALLIGWESLPSLSTQVPFDAGSSSYCLGATAREAIITNFGWIITDSGFDDVPPDVVCPADQMQSVISGEQYSVPDYFGTGDATASDYCTNPVTDLSQDPPPGTMLSAGTYTVILTAEDLNGNAGNCSFELTISEILGIETLNNGIGISLLPNPIWHEEVVLMNTENVDIQHVAFYDITGRLIKTFEIQDPVIEKTFDVSFLQTGNYIAVISTKTNRVVKQIVKQ